jgi:hypothetical protein
MQADFQILGCGDATERLHVCRAFQWHASVDQRLHRHDTIGLPNATTKATTDQHKTTMYVLMLRIEFEHVLTEGCSRPCDHILCGHHPARSERHALM